ncbi:MAG: class I SAM-dependent methyltransferase [Limisphaerales bacterium]
MGKHDPLWAVVSHPDKRGQRWDIAEFMATGEQSISYYYQLLQRYTGNLQTFSHVLDFGCGAGRLTCAWAKRAERVTGVDISSSMLEVAAKNAAGCNNVNFVLNQDHRLGLFDGQTFDLVFSLICLQHVPWPIAAEYIREFSRICKPEGIVAFQLPSRTLRSSPGNKLRKFLVDCMPLGLNRLYRQWRHGSPVVFEMYYTPCSRVEAVAKESGLALIHKEPDGSAGENTEGFFYIFKKI